MGLRVRIHVGLSRAAPLIGDGKFAALSERKIAVGDALGLVVARRLLGSKVGQRAGKPISSS